jgi:hypothetical protein
MEESDKHLQEQLNQDDFAVAKDDSASDMKWLNEQLVAIVNSGVGFRRKLVFLKRILKKYEFL